MKEKIWVSVVSALITAVVTSFALAALGWIRVQLSESAETQLIEKIREDERLHLAVAGKLDQALKPVWVSRESETDEPKDEGLLDSRFVEFKKQFDATAVRVGYTDILSATGNHAACQWEIRFNGRSCPSGRLTYNYFTQGIGDAGYSHRSRHVVGYCEGLPARDYSVQVHVGPVNEGPDQIHGDCYTGWRGGTWTLELQEILASR